MKISEKYRKKSEKYRHLSEKVGKNRKKSGKIGQTKFLCSFLFEAHRKNDISAKYRPKKPKFLSMTPPLNFKVGRHLVEPDYSAQTVAHIDS